MRKIFLLSLVLLLCLNVVVALDINNVKLYDKNTETATIKDSYYGKELLNATLNTPRVFQVPYGDIYKVAEFDVLNLDTNTIPNFLDQNKIINLKTNREESKIIFYKYKVTTVRTINESVKTDCKNDDPYKNGTLVESCKTSYKTTTIYGEAWEDLKSFDILKGQRITVGMFTYVSKGDRYEWIPTLLGKDVPEWATWTASLNANLMAYYKLNNNSNYSVGIANGTDLNTAYVSAKLDYGANFSNNGHIDYGDVYDINTSNFSVSFWARYYGSGSYDYFLGKSNAGGSSDWEIRVSNVNKVEWTIFGGGTAVGVTTAGTVNNGQWIHYVATRDTGNGTDVLKLYLNGVLNGTAVADGAKNPDGSDPFRIGRDGATNSFYLSGTVDEVGLWNRVLSASEVSDLYNGGVGITYVGVTPASINLLSPANGTSTTTPTNNFICNVSDAQGVRNVSLVFNNVIVSTNSSGVNNVNYTFSYSISQGAGTYPWNCQVYNTVNLTSQATANYSITYTNWLTAQHVSPANAHYTNNSALSLVGYAMDETGVLNVSLVWNGVKEQTNTTGLNNTNYTFTKTLSTETTYNWGVNACDTNGCTTTTNRTVIYDITKPVFTTNYNQDQVTTTLPLNVTVNITTTDTNLNTCWYYTSDNATNTTVTCNSVYNISWGSGGNKTVYYFANDSAGNQNLTSYTFLINYVVVSVSYSSPVVEGNNQTITLNVYATQLNNLTGSLLWNGTSKTVTTSSNSTNGNVSSTFTIPAVTVDQNVTFNFTYIINGISTTSTNYYQIVNFLQPINISASCSDKALRFWIQTEANLTNITGSVNYNFLYGPINNNTLKQAYGSISNVSEFYLCINATASPTYYLGYGELQYSSTGYVDRRYYLFENKSISNSTLEFHYLRELPTTDQTSFLLTFEDSDLTPYTNHYTALWRWYPDLNQYQIVEMGKTDSDGQTVAHVRTEDVDYRTALYELNGTLIAYDSPRRFVCVESPCTLTIRPTTTETDQTAFFDVQVSLDYNETTKIITLTYNDPNQYTSGMSLLVERLTGSSVLTICNTTSTGFTGVISCNASAYSGTFKATVYRYASPGVPIATRLYSTANTFFKSGFGLFISVIIWLGVALTGLTGNPIVMVIAGVVGLIPALILGSINATIFTGVAVLGMIILHFIRRALA